ncbi:MAG: filamentation induced by cAMP protein fic [Thermoanaerobaculia bacterium]
MSRYIVERKPDYYRLLQAVRDDGAWEEWTIYLLTAVEETAREGVTQVERIKALMLDVKHRIRAKYRFYSQDLIHNLFYHPYTKIGFVERDLEVSRLTATRYLEELTAGGFVAKRKVGRTNFYINLPLCRILAGDEIEGGEG